MTRCLDEAKLQSYFDGELSVEMMESVASHLAACVTCAAAARQLEDESALLATALAAEFETSVPTERLRERINAAVLGERLLTARATTRQTSGLAFFFSNLFTFGTQRTLGYASLVVVMAFAAVAGVVMMKSSETQQSQNQEVVSANKLQEVKVAASEESGPEPMTSPAQPDLVEPIVVAVANPPKNERPVRRSAPLATPVPRPEPVKLLPGERTYLQTIARLDSTIKANMNTMRPSLQAEYKRNLAVVDQAIAATRTAAKSNPNDPDAADFVFAAYQSKVDLLNTIADARLTGGPRH